MGDSEKLSSSGPDSYSFFEHRTFSTASWMPWVSRRSCSSCTIGVRARVRLAYRHPDRIRAIVYMEAIVGTLRWDDYDPRDVPSFRGFARQRETGWHWRKRSRRTRASLQCAAETHDPGDGRYRRPYRMPGESRRPTLSWPRQLPIDGEPPDVCAEVERYAKWLANCDQPKLFVNAEPGRLLTAACAKERSARITSSPRFSRLRTRADPTCPVASDPNAAFAHVTSAMFLTGEIDH